MSMKIIVNPDDPEKRREIETNNTAEKALEAFGFDPKETSYETHEPNLEQLKDRIEELENESS